MLCFMPGDLTANPGSLLTKDEESEIFYIQIITEIQLIFSTLVRANSLCCWSWNRSDFRSKWIRFKTNRAVAHTTIRTEMWQILPLPK